MQWEELPCPPRMCIYNKHIGVYQSLAPSSGNQDLFGHGGLDLMGASLECECDCSNETLVQPSYIRKIW